MIRVVIIEDEMLVRIGVKMCIGRYDPQLNVVRDFSCGEDALEYFEQNTADVLVTDIRLNGISGLDMIRQLKKKHPHMVFIILSCYEDFSYAKEAIELGVHSYLLKHEIGEEEIPRNILEQYEKKKHSISQENYEYMDKVTDSRDEDMENIFLVSLLVFRQKGEKRNTSMEDINHEILIEILQKHLNDDSLGDCFSHHNREICILFRFRKEDDSADIRIRIMNFWHEAVISVQNYFNRNAYMILSEPYYDLKKTKEHYGYVLEKADLNFYYENSACIHLEEENRKTTKELPELRLLKDNIFKDSWCQEMNYEIGLFLKRCCSESISAKDAKYRIMKLLNEIELYLEQNYKGMTFGTIFEKSEYPGYRKIESYDSAEQLEKEISRILHKICVFIQRQKEEIYIIERYIQENYAEQISLTRMAATFHMSSVYFCQYFKKKKGITYLQFLNQIRIEKAKELLEKREYSQEQISQMVGINNVNYFGRLFKKITGMTVSEYQKLKS